MRNAKIKMMETQLIIFSALLLYAFTSVSWRGFVKAIVEDICCWCLCWSVMYKLLALISVIHEVGSPFVLTGWCYTKVSFYIKSHFALKSKFLLTFLEEEEDFIVSKNSFFNSPDIS
jgi:hypothetical protein